MYDVLVIGGGVIGCAIARELSRRSGRICVVERNEDVCTGTSKANSAIVHAGFDAEPGTRKARFNVEDVYKRQGQLPARCPLEACRCFRRPQAPQKRERRNSRCATPLENALSYIR